MLLLTVFLSEAQHASHARNGRGILPQTEHLLSEYQHDSSCVMFFFSHIEENYSYIVVLLLASAL